MIKEVSDIVDMVVRVNFKRLMTMFNVIIVCPVSKCNLVVEAMTTSGAAKTQQGFIVNLGRRRETRTKGKWILSHLLKVHCSESKAIIVSTIFNKFPGA